MLDSSSQTSGPGGVRHATLFYSSLGLPSDWMSRQGARKASALANRLLSLQEIIITRDRAGRILQFGRDTVFAVFDKASDALSRSLEIQRVLLPANGTAGSPPAPQVRIGLHMGEVLIQQGERVEIVSRHVSRAFRVMEMAGPGRVYATAAVVEAGRDFVDLPVQALALEHFGEFYLEEVGATSICEVADLRLVTPAPPALPGMNQVESCVIGRLELAGFRSLRRLGEGPHGVVYQAARLDSEKPVVVKVLSPEWSGNERWLGRFENLTQRLRDLAPFDVALPREIRLQQPPAYVVMDQVEGQALDAALTGAEPQRVGSVFRRVCAALETVHNAGVVHGNLKPSNVLVTKNGEPRLLDFGFGTEPGAPAPSAGRETALDPATAAFAAPESIQNGEASARSDIYSLGAMLFRVLAGRDAFPGASVHEIVQGQLHRDPPLPASVTSVAVADGLQRICLKAMEKNPAERYANVREMREDLDRFLRGEVIKTRPSAYDNVLFHRVQRHVEDIQAWSEEGVLSEEESHRLLSGYEGLQRRGPSAVMEGRVYRLWQTLVYMGGWAVINGALLWLVLHWETLGRTQKLLLGSVPALTTFVLAWFMNRLERYRLVFVALLVGVLAVPLLVGVWLHEFHWGSIVPQARMAQELFFSEDTPGALTNVQIFWSACMTVAAAWAIMLYTRTTAHSAQLVVASVLFYSAGLLFFDLKPYLEQEKWATLALQYLPLAGFLTWGSWRLLAVRDRPHQAAPWILASALVLMLILYGIAFGSLEQWTSWERERRTPASYLVLSVCGVIQTSLGLWARKALRHRGRLAVFLLVFVGLLNVLAGLMLAGWKETWPEAWWSPHLLGMAVPLPHLLLPLASMGIATLACRFQLVSFLVIGLAGLAMSIHLLGDFYFRDAAGWPKWVMGAGVACFFGALYLELKRTRGNAIDDVVSQKRL